jgi:hypothetical protein
MLGNETTLAANDSPQPSAVKATVLLVLAAISDVMIPHYIGMTVSAIVKGEADGTLEERPYKAWTVQ